MQFLYALRDFSGRIMILSILGAIGTLFFQLEPLFYVVLTIFIVSVFTYLGLYIFLYFFGKK